MSKRRERKTVAFDRFDPNQIMDGNVVLAIGKRGSGKSVATRSMLYQLRHRFAYGIASSGTEGSTGFYASFVPDLFVYDHLDMDVLDRMFELQKERVRRLGKCRETSMLLVLDDVLAEGPKIWRSPQLVKVISEGRHFNITCFILIQYVKALPPTIRSNTDWAILLSDPIRANRKKIHEEFAGVFASFQDFVSAFESLTCDRECMIVQMSSVLSSDVRKSIFFYGATMDLPSFRMFDRELEEFHRRHHIEFQPKKQKRDVERNRRTAPLADTLVT